MSFFVYSIVLLLTDCKTGKLFNFTPKGKLVIFQFCVVLEFMLIVNICKRSICLLMLGEILMSQTFHSPEKEHNYFCF